MLELTSSGVLQVPYSKLIHGLHTQNIHINRKMLSELAMYEPYSFKALVDQVSFMRGGVAQQPAAQQSAQL